MSGKDYREINKQTPEKCDHRLEIPISEGGDILFWRCQCGLKREKAKNSKNEEMQRK